MNQFGWKGVAYITETSALIGERFAHAYVKHSITNNSLPEVKFVLEL